MRPHAILLVALLVCTGLAGCAGFGPYGSTHEVSATRLEEGQWNRDSTFRVMTKDNATIRIVATDGGREVTAEGLNDVSITIPDGTWTVTYWIDGRKWNTHHDVRIDTTPPGIVGLQTLAEAEPGGSYLLGNGAAVSDAVGLWVTDLRSGEILSRTLPLLLTDLPVGLQAYMVSARDEAGNFNNVTVQVHVGSAADLPDGQYTFGVVARYTNTIRLWDLTDPTVYLSIDDAQAQVPPTYLGSGFGVTPNDAEVRRVVAEVVRADMNTMQAAIALYQWFADNLEYDETRLESELLLSPRQVLTDSEDPEGRDCDDETGQAPDCDGIVKDGPGNGVRGGICRDLAATFVSLLRAAGVPARLVSGYVAGTVNGFHAWVEFYAGSVAGQSPWVPVDVSTIDGPFRPDGFLQSFGIQLPEYLPLRSVPPAGETEGWSTAISVHYTWPQGTGQGTPDVQFRKSLTADYSHTGVLCFNTATRARLVAGNDRECTGFTFYIDDFVRQTERLIDYGIEVVSAPKGTNVRAEVAYPFEDDIHPDRVVYQFYGPPMTLDSRTGKATSEFWPQGR